MKQKIRKTWSVWSDNSKFGTDKFSFNYEGLTEKEAYSIADKYTKSYSLSENESLNFIVIQDMDSNDDDV